MAYAKVISTTFGVTIAVVHSGSFSGDLDIYNNRLQENITPYSGSIYNLPSAEMTAMDLYHAISPLDHTNMEALSDFSSITIYRQENGQKKVIEGESIALSPDIRSVNDIQIFYFERQNTAETNSPFDNQKREGFNNFYQHENAINFHSDNPHSPHLQQNSFRIGALISGGPDGIIASSLMKEAGSIGNYPVEGYDFFYIRAGRPSDWQEFEAIQKYLQSDFNYNYDLHVIDISTGEMRLLLCGEYEATYTRFGLSSALSLVSATCEKLANKPRLILFGIHGADASFKAKKSNEYTRKFVNKWNSFWESFYPLRPLYIAPLIDVFDKIDILKMALPLGIDLKKTWSCYKGGKNHCGQCKSCLERRLAFQIAQISDSTQYEDTPDCKKLKDRIGGVTMNINEQQIQLSS